MAELTFANPCIFDLDSSSRESTESPTELKPYTVTSRESQDMICFGAFRPRMHSGKNVRFFENILQLPKQGDLPGLVLARRGTENVGEKK